MKVASVTVSAMAHGLCVGGVHWWLSTGAGKRIPIVSALSSAELVLGGSLQNIKGEIPLETPMTSFWIQVSACFLAERFRNERVAFVRAPD
jgi:hypothetical protein